MRIRSSDCQTSAHCSTATEGGEEEENKGGNSGCANRKVLKPVQGNKRILTNKTGLLGGVKRRCARLKTVGLKLSSG